MYQLDTEKHHKAGLAENGYPNLPRLFSLAVTWQRILFQRSLDCRFAPKCHRGTHDAHKSQLLSLSRTKPQAADIARTDRASRWHGTLRLPLGSCAYFASCLRIRFRFPPAFSGGLGVCHLELLERIQDNLGNDQPGILLACGVQSQVQLSIYRAAFSIACGQLVEPRSCVPKLSRSVSELDQSGPERIKLAHRRST